EPQGSSAPMASQHPNIAPPTGQDVDMLEVPANAKGKKRSRSDEKPSRGDKDPIVEPASKMILLKTENMSVRYEAIAKQLLEAQKLAKRLNRECDDLKGEKAAVQNLLISTQHQMHTLSEAHAKLTRSHSILLSQPGSSTEKHELQDMSSGPVSLTGEEVMRLTMDFTSQAQELQNTKELLAHRDREISTVHQELEELKNSLGQREKDLEEKNQNNMAQEKLANDLASQRAALE
ncbi:hypothetical protein EV360DRAFT_77300, partial [Lentinula raphanica]